MSDLCSLAQEGLEEQEAAAAAQAQGYLLLAPQPHCQQRPREEVMPQQQLPSLQAMQLQPALGRGLAAAGQPPPAAGAAAPGGGGGGSFISGVGGGGSGSGWPRSFELGFAPFDWDDLDLGLGL
jgi:hypothetical protein